MAVNLSFIGGAGWQFFDDNGVPLAGGKIYTYVAGSSTPLPTYTSWSGTTPNTNPIILDAAGRTPQQVWSTEGILYKYVVKASDDTLIRTWDNVGGSVVASDLAQDLASTTDNAKGDALIGFRQSNSLGFIAGSVGRTLNAKMQEFVSVKDFGAVGDGITNDTAAIQAALNASSAVYFPRGTYALATQLTLNTAQKLYGDGYASVLLSIGTNTNIMFGTNISNIEISNLFFRGNASGTGTAGYGIRLLNTTFINIHDCYFDGIGNSTGYAGCISGESCSEITVHNNTFLGNSGGSTTGSDIGFGYYGKQCIITNNISVSNHDTMISLAAVAVNREDATHHIVANNIGIRRDSNTSRSGAIIAYGNIAAYSIVSGNIFYNFIWNGIYVQAAISNTLPTAGVTIQGNIVRYCGGQNASIGAGVYLAGNNGLTCTGNLVEYTGYNASGVYRGSVNNGILVQNSASNLTITGNIVRYSKGAGIYLTPLTGYIQQNITVTGNELFDNENGGITLNPTSSTSFIRDVVISNNVVKQSAYDADGFNIQLSGSAGAPNNILISNNVFTGVTGSARSGIRTNTAVPLGWVIRGNFITSFSKGFECATFPADQLYGTACILDGNTIKDCTTGYAIGSNGIAQNGYVFNASYINVTTRHASPQYSDAVNIGNGNIELRRAAAPLGGTWRVGDRVTYTVPTAGGFLGAVCTTAGTPGTWKTFGAISP